MLRALLLSLLVGVAARAADPKVELDKFVVHGGERTLAIPYAQLLDLSARATPSFTLTAYTLRPSRKARLAEPLRHLLRRADGRVLQELPDATGVHALDPQFRATLASSNQPAKLNQLYLLLRANRLRQPGPLDRAALRQLLDDYTAFATARLNEARQLYEAGKHDDFLDVQRLILPDQIVVFLPTEARATALAAATGGTADGRAVRFLREQLLAPRREAGPDPFSTIGWTDVACVTPWRQEEPLPEVVEGAALLLVGWVTYRPHWLARSRSELIAPGLASQY